MGYAGHIQQEGTWNSCTHIHDSISEALACARARAAESGASATSVVGADMGPEGIPKERRLTDDEEATLATLRE
jgi:hypothetical protein